MTYDMGNTDKLNVFRQELDRLGVALLPPDVNASRADFGVERQAEGGPAIRYALAAVKNVGATAMAALVAEREANGPFRDLGDLAARLDNRIVNKRQVESLAWWARSTASKGTGTRAFQGAEALIVTPPRQPVNEVCASQPVRRRCCGKSCALGLARDRGLAGPGTAAARVRSHRVLPLGAPLDAYGGMLERMGVSTSADLRMRLASAPGRRKLAGIVIGKQERTSRQGNRFAFVQLSDTSGVFEVIVFSELLAQHRELLESGQPLLVTVSVDSRDDGESPRMTAQALAPLERAAAEASTGLKLFLSDQAPLDSLKAVLGRDEGAAGRGCIALLELNGGEEAEMELPGTYQISSRLRQAIKAIPGLVVQEA